MKTLFLTAGLCLVAMGIIFSQTYYSEQDIRNAYDRGFRNGYGIGYNDSRSGYYYRSQNPGNLNQRNNFSQGGGLNSKGLNNQQMQQFEQMMMNLDNYYMNMIQNQNQNRNQIAPGGPPNQNSPGSSATTPNRTPSNNSDQFRSNPQRPK